MGVPFLQQFSVGQYVINRKLRGLRQYLLVLMLEPLFRCNLACAGCGKIVYPKEILNRQLSLEECLSAVDECGAPIVSVTGGEPLLHRDMPQIIAAIIQRKKFVYLCTNGLLLEDHLKDFRPSPYLTISIHLDGDRKHHDSLACREGVYARAVEAIKLARSGNFRVAVNCTLYDGVTAAQAAGHFDFLMSLGVEGIMVSPGFGYGRAPQKGVFLPCEESKQLFREIFRMGRGRNWRFNQSSLFLDFLAGNQAYACTPWGNPTRNVFGWQRPCYLLTKEGYAPSFKALIDETNWERYGNGRNPKCANCMLHSGFEATAVNDIFGHPLKALWVYLRGPRTHGPTTLEQPFSSRDSMASAREGQGEE